VLFILNKRSELVQWQSDTQSHNPGDIDKNIHRHKNLKYHQLVRETTLLFIPSKQTFLRSWRTNNTQLSKLNPPLAWSRH